MTIKYFEEIDSSKLENYYSKELEINSKPIDVDLNFESENINENDFYEAVIQLLDDKYRTMVITKGFAQSSKFSWDITIEKYTAFYKELYDKRK